MERKPPEVAKEAINLNHLHLFFNSIAYIVARSAQTSEFRKNLQLFLAKKYSSDSLNRK